MEQPTVRDNGDGTRRQLEPSPPATAPEEDDLSDLPEIVPLWDAAQSCCYCLFLIIFLSALTDLTISTYLVPSWGWLFSERAVIVVALGALFYMFIDCLLGTVAFPFVR
ncbi:hypothetical protein MTO96_038975 [Rhipicephalus appendiculatus]